MTPPNVLGAPFLVMEKVAGTCPSPWGREGRAFYQAAAERGVARAPYTESLQALFAVMLSRLCGIFSDVPCLYINYFQRNESSNCEIQACAQ